MCLGHLPTQSLPALVVWELLPLSDRLKLSCEEISISHMDGPSWGEVFSPFPAARENKPLGSSCVRDLPFHWVDLMDTIHCSWTLPLPEKMT